MAQCEGLREKGKIQECIKLRKILRSGSSSMCQDKPESADEYLLEI
jgi:hypothetical protein